MGFVKQAAGLLAVVMTVATMPARSETPHLPGLPGPAVWQNETPGWAVDDHALTIVAGKKTDWFQWPGGGYHADSSPRLLIPTQGDFSLVTQVDVTAHTTYDAGCIALYGTADHWAKLCLEAQAAGGFAVISVVTRDLSDDVTSFPVAGTSTWLKVARDKDVFFFYASSDGKTWQIVRKFNLTSTDSFKVGVSAQSPDGDGASAHFTGLRYGAGPINLWDLH